jgi:methyltransferase
LTALALAAAIFAAMVGEAVVARRHDRVLRGLGAVEPRRDVYAIMQLAYPAAFLAMTAEGMWRGVAPDDAFIAGVSLLLAAKALKYWAIAALGGRWTFRVLVPPGSSRIVGGPYRFLSHPNYLAVAGEIAGCALAMRAVTSGPIAFVAFGLLMLRRIQIEETALAGE